MILLVPHHLWIEILIPALLSLIGYKQTREDSHLSGIHYFSNCPEMKTQVSVNDYVACNCIEKWRVELVLKVNITQQDAQVKFMHAPGPSKSFFQPVKEDVC